LRRRLERLTTPARAVHRVATVRGSHVLQEDSPHEIGRAIAEFVEPKSAA